MQSYTLLAATPDLKPFIEAGLGVLLGLTSGIAHAQNIGDKN